MKKYGILLLSALLFWGSALFAQNGEDPKISIKFDARLDGQATFYRKDDAGNRPDTESGFIGKYFKLLVDGKISDKFSYSFRHRLYMDHGDPKAFFSATDWLNVTYRPTEKFSVTAGKQMVFIGTYEYDAAPIDVYYASYFWNHVSPFQIGLNVGYSPAEGHTLHAQVTNSPFCKKALEGLYAYNIMWYGKIAPFWKTTYSVNMIEYQKGDFMNYIALGNRFNFGRLEFDIDYMNRYGGKGTAFFEDFTILGRFSYAVTDNFNIFTKGGYDQNKTGKELDWYVHNGVEEGYYGAGLEYFPIKSAKQALRLHAFWSGSTAATGSNTINIGIRWQINALNR